jgi:transposase
VRSLSLAERQQLQSGLRSADALRLRRCQILLASADGQSAKPIAKSYGCSVQTVRNTIHEFDQRGLDCLNKQSNRPKSVQAALAGSQAQRLQAILHQSPRSFGQGSSVWTLEMAAQVCFEQGLTQRRLSRESVRRAIRRLGIGWKRAKHWIASPDPAYARKKSAGIA